MKTTAHSEKGEHTKEQLVAAAQKLFAEKGFRGTSIRDIVNEAGSNLAAVNYHFGSKENLYQEVFRRHKSLAKERGIRAVKEVMTKNDGKPTIEAVLEAYAHGTRESREYCEERSFKTLIDRELEERQLEPRFLFDEVFEPLMRDLGEAISAGCPGLDAKAVKLCVHSFLAQLIHLRTAETYFGGLDAEDIPMLDTAVAIRHIVRFTSAGIRAQRKQNL